GKSGRRPGRPRHAPGTGSSAGVGGAGPAQRAPGPGHARRRRTLGRDLPALRPGRCRARPPGPGPLTMTDPATPSASTYLHGSSPTEQARLTLLNDFLNQASLRELGLRGGEKILDVGSGLGQFSRAMARAAGRAGHVLGIEADARQLAEAARQAHAAG